MESQIFRIVFEDPELLVVEKLRPFLSQKADSGKGEGLYELISRGLGYPVYPVHRLDREVLGLMVFGKTQRAAEHLSRQFKERTIAKGYFARVFGRVSADHDTLVHFLKKNPHKNYVTVFPRETPGAQRAELDYDVLSRGESETELLIRLKTGRSHQIRAQLAKLGHPILGDFRYGKRFGEGFSAYQGPIQLKSIFLGLAHPQGGKRLWWSLLDESQLPESLLQSGPQGN